MLSKLLRILGIPLSSHGISCRAFRMPQLIPVLVAITIVSILYYVSVSTDFLAEKSDVISKAVAKQDESASLERNDGIHAFQVTAQVEEPEVVDYRPVVTLRPAKTVPTQLFISATKRGGLGNLLFQYATAYGLARRSGKRIHLTADNELLTLLPAIRNHAYVTRKFDDILDKHDLIDPKHCGFAHRVVEESTKPYNVAMIGYFQSFRYFDDYREDLRAYLRFNDKIQSEASFQMHKVRAKAMKALNTNSSDKVNDLTWIAVHIRRGDIMDKSFAEYGYMVATPEYLRKSAAYFTSKYATKNQGVVFLVFSDELDWAKGNFATSGNFKAQMVCVEFIMNEKSEVDLQLMIQCNATIMTVGSFGWWSAYLGGGEAFYYAHPFRAGSPLSTQFEMEDYYPPEWHLFF